MVSKWNIRMNGGGTTCCIYIFIVALKGSVHLNALMVRKEAFK
jgi:hypothetical protein